jgi:hypothetical protein
MFFLAMSVSPPGPVDVLLQLARNGIDGFHRAVIGVSVHAAATNLGNFNASAVGTTTKAITGCLELVRYKYSFSGNSTDRWIHLRMNPPIWQPN